MALSKRLRLRYLSVVTLFSLVIGLNSQLISSIVTYAAESIGWNFNTNQLSDFTKYVSSGAADTTSWQSTGGTANSGTIFIDATQVSKTVYVSKAAYSLGNIGSTYKFSAFMFSQGSPGYSGMGFTSTAPSSSTVGGAPSNPFRPNDALGISVHGSGYVFHNAGNNYSGYWLADSPSSDPAITRTTKWSDADGTSGMINCSTDANSDGVPDYTADTCWFKVVYTITYKGSNTFDTKVEVWEANADGTLDDATVDTVHEVNGITNATIGGASTIYSYINFSGTRMQYFDDFSVELSGGASVIEPGAPVVLTSSASETNGIITVGGNVTSNNGFAVTERGFVYGTSTGPTISGNKIADGSSGTGTYTGNTSQLADGTYYVRAYATNSSGTSYGSESTVTVTSPTVTFNKNDGSGTTASQASRTSAALTTNSFNRSGYTFSGWNTDSDGTGTAYADDATFAFTSDDTLYAQWLKSTPSVDATHDIWIQGDGSDPDNGTSTSLTLKMGTSGTGSGYKRVALLRFDYDPSYVWTSAALDLVVSSNTKGNSDPGYGVSFKSFNVNVFGANDADWAESSLDFTSASTTTSDWKISFTHPYSTPGATLLGNLSVPANSRPGGPYPTVGETYSLSNSDLVTFLNNDSDGKVTFFITRSDTSDQSNLSFASSENTTYDGPKLSVPGGSFSYPVAYDINGGTGTAPDQGAYVVGTPYTVASPSSITPPTGKSFAGWNSRPGGNGTSYSVGSSYSTAASVTLYAQYTSNPVVTYDSNDGTSQTSYQAVPSATATALTANSFTRVGYTFSGWDTSSGGGGTAYSDGANITTSSAVTLYAQWTATSSGSSGSSGTSGGTTARRTTPTPMVLPPVVNPQPRLPLPPSPAPSTRPLTSALPQIQSGVPSVSRVTIGGVPAPLSTARTSPDSINFSAGRFALNVGVDNGGEVVENTESGQLEITVRDGSIAAISGNGLRPLTTVQVWLPGVRESELGRVTVDANGNIAGSVNLGASAGEPPLPIGKRVLQVTGFDEDGNQAVIELPINIAQSAPAPEPNRQAGALPDLAPAQTLHTSAGMPVSATVTPLSDQNLLTVDGGDWAVSVSLANGAGSVAGEQDAPTLTMQQTGVGSVFGSGFQPGTLASVWLFSDPTLLATVQVADDGTVSTNFLVDGQFIPAGEHTLQIQAVGTDGFIKATNIGVAIEEPPQVTTSANSDVLLWWVAAAFVALMLLIAVVVAVRRGRKFV